MELKNAVAVCLISLFAATLVVLIARSLDSQAAARLEPPLARIVEELEAIRKQGGIAASPNAPPASTAEADGLVVYYFHATTRCPTCKSIESQAKNVVQTDFAQQLSNGEIVWKSLNYEEPANALLAKKFEIQAPVVVLAKIKGGEIENFNRMDEVWGLVGDEAAFAKHIHDEIARMLAADAKTAAAPSDAAAAAARVPTDESPQDDSRLSVSKNPVDLPVPQ